jgi:hypothetical protein
MHFFPPLFLSIFSLGSLRECDLGDEGASVIASSLKVNLTLTVLAYELTFLLSPRTQD